MLPHTCCYLIIVLKNIDQIFRPITLVKHMLITSRYVATNHCLSDRLINALTTLPRRIFLLRVSKALKLWKIQSEELKLSCFT